MSISFEDTFELFSPDSFAKRQSLARDNRTLVHYTSASNALNIIRTKRLWMRNAQCMNDFSEVTHGIDCLIQCFKQKVGADFLHTLNNIQPRIAEEAINIFDDLQGHIQNNTFVACFSEHPERENEFGRLSMWRAYGNNTVGVAMVLSRAPFYLRINDGLFSHPVSYFSQSEFLLGFKQMSDQVHRY